MSVVKVIKVIGQSPNSFDEAVKNAVKESTRNLRNVKSFEVDAMSGEISDGEVTRYRAAIEVAFVVEGNEDEDAS